MMKVLQLFLLTFIIFACHSTTPKDEKAAGNMQMDPLQDTTVFEHDYTDYDVGDSVQVGPLMVGETYYGIYIDPLEWRQMILGADKIEAYNWNGNEDNPANTYHYMIRNGRIDKSARLVKTLNPDETIEWVDIVTDSTIYNGFRPMCFIPHIAFLYYKNDIIVGQSNVCFLCSAIFSLPGTTNSLNETEVEKVKAFCQSLGLEIKDSY